MMTAYAPPADGASRDAIRLNWAGADRLCKKLAVGIVCFNVGLALLSGLASLFLRLGWISASGANWLYISQDNNLAELVGDFEFLSAAALMAFTYGKTGRKLHLAIAIFITYLVCDDFFMLHDRARVWLGDVIGFENQFFSKIEFGELVYALSMLSVVSATILLFLRKHVRIRDFALSWPVILPVGVFLGMAVGMDQTHQIVMEIIGDKPLVHHLFNFAEDGGEFLAQGLTLAMALLLWSAQPRAR